MILGLVLCGGKGTRMQGVLPMGMPKCAVHVGGRPVWEYAALAAAKVATEGEVVLATGPWARHALSIAPFFNLIFDDQQGTVPVVRKLFAHREDVEAVAVFNGDTLLFGTFELPTLEDRVVRILARKRELHSTDLYTPQHGRATAAFVVPRQAVLPDVRNLEDVKPFTTVRATKTLSFVDCGTPEGLRNARRILDSAAEPFKDVEDCGCCRS